MDATMIRSTRQPLLATLLLTSFLSTPLMAIEIPSIAPSQVITFGDPDAVDANPQRRTAVVTAVVLSPDARRLAAAGDDHIVRMFGVSSGELEQELPGHRDWIRGLSIAKDGRTIASAAADSCCRCWNTETGQPLRVAKQGNRPLRCVAFHPDGDKLAAAGYCCPPCIYDLAGKHTARRFSCPRHDHTAIAFSPDGQTLAATSADGTLRIWDVSAGQMLQHLAADTRRLRAVAFSPDGRLVAVGGDGSHVGVWNVATGEKFQKLPTRPAKVYCLKFLSNSELAIGGSDNRIQIWRTAGASLVKLLEGHTGTVTTLDADQTGNLLISGSYDTTIRIWHLDDPTDHKTATRAADTNR